VTGRLGGYIKMSIPERRDAVQNLTAEGHSVRETAEILGVSHGTINNDVQFWTPGEETQADEPSAEGMTTREIGEVLGVGKVQQPATLRNRLSQVGQTRRKPTRNTRRKLNPLSKRDRRRQAQGRRGRERRQTFDGRLSRFGIAADCEARHVPRSPSQLRRLAESRYRARYRIEPGGAECDGAIAARALLSQDGGGARRGGKTGRSRAISCLLRAILKPKFLGKFWIRRRVEFFRLSRCYLEGFAGCDRALAAFRRSGAV
jgi:transposase